MICRTVNDPSVIALTPQPHSVDATLFNGAHHQRPSGGIDRSLFSLSRSLYFPTSNKRHRHRHTALAKIAPVRVPLILPPSLKTRARLQLFVGLTLAESVSLHCGCHIESVISSATQWPLLGENTISSPEGERGGGAGALGRGRIISGVFLADRRCHGFRFLLMGRFKVCVAALE